MCLAVPGEVLDIFDDPVQGRAGRVSFGGILKTVNLAYVPEARVGQFVIVHVGFAISVLDAEEAARLLRYLQEMDELAELQAGQGGQRERPAPRDPRSGDALS